jgi:tRNA-specific 2-thiouridylase
MAEGDIVDTNGRQVGVHCGIANYTIGQRRGIGIPEGLRVTDIDTTTNKITVGSKDDLYKHTLYITDCNIVNDNEACTSDDIMVKIRGIGINPTQPARIEHHGDGYIVKLSDPAWAPAKGQPLVFYRDNLVIGGGIVVDYK